jgi:hypothetical protein
MYGKKYGSFSIENEMATWNQDNNVKFPIYSIEEDCCLYEGIWNPHARLDKHNQYYKAIAGVCIWNKYDCLFILNPIDKGNPGAIRSLSSPRDKIDLLKRLNNGQTIKQIILSSDPIGDYQRKTILWQASIVRRFNVKHLYYILPLFEYKKTIEELKPFINSSMMDELHHVLEEHYLSIKRYIMNQIKINLEFIYPLNKYPFLTIEESYIWPYENLSIDLGIEEMEEVRIPYQVKKNGRTIPPIILGMLDDPCPYYQKREDFNDNKIVISCNE